MAYESVRGMNSTSSHSERAVAEWWRRTWHCDRARRYGSEACSDGHCGRQRDEVGQITWCFAVQATMQKNGSMPHFLRFTYMFVRLSAETCQLLLFVCLFVVLSWLGSCCSHLPVFTGLAPPYLADDCRLVSLTDRILRPVDTRTCVVPRTNTRFGYISFSTCGPKIWNSLSSALRQPGLSFAAFKQHLKSYLLIAISDRGA